jgi:hypothetical protein
MTEITEDFNSMSEDELKNFINKHNDEESEADQVDENESAIQTESVSAKQDQAEPETAKPNDPILESPFYKGKSREEVIEMQENAKRKISQQQNELHQMRLEMENIKGQVSALAKPVETKEDPFEAALKTYDKEDLRIIEQIAERKIREKEELRLNETKEKTRKAQEANEATWRILAPIISSTYPTMANQIQDEIMDKIKADPENTLNKEGWLESYWRSYKVPESASSRKTESNEVVVKRKIMAATVGGGNGSVSGNGTAKKSVESMNAEEYADYMLTKGIDIRKGTRSS